MDEQISVKHLSHSFANQDGAPLQIIDNISFSAGPGEIVAILGPSGSGKSTILRCISGLLNFSGGSIKIGSRDPVVAKQQKLIGFAFQESCLLNWLTVEDNIQLPTRVGKKNMSEDEIQARTEKLLSLIGLERFRNYYPDQLSGGMKQRVSFARSLIIEPEALLLDEPFSALDLNTQTKLLIDFYRILTLKNISTILVTHSPEQAVFLAHRIYILTDLPATIQNTIENPHHLPRDLAIYENPEFIDKVIHCRKQIL